MPNTAAERQTISIQAGGAVRGLAAALRSLVAWNAARDVADLEASVIQARLQRSLEEDVREIGTRD